MSTSITGKPATKSLKDHLKAWTTWVVVMLVFMSLSIWYSLATSTQNNHLSPDSFGPTGSRAFFKILERHAESVEYLYSTSKIKEADADTTVVILNSPWTYSGVVGDILDKSQNARRIVTVDVRGYEMEKLGFVGEITGSPYYPDDVLHRGKCPVDIFGKVTEVSGTSTVFDSGFHRPPIQCFLTFGVSPVAIYPPGEVTSQDFVTRNLPQTVAFSSGEWFTNRHTAVNQNGSLGITVINKTPKIHVYYITENGFNNNFPGEDTDRVREFFPVWVQPATYLLISATLFLIVVRRRRFGRLAYERLPITVKSSETIHSLGRLYEQNQSTARAAQLLQLQTQRRLRKALYLNSFSSNAELINLVVARTNKDPQLIQRLLFQPFNGSSTELASFTKQLDALIQEVTHD